MAERSDKIFKNLDEGSDKMNKMLTEMRDFLQVASRSDGTLSRLLNDPSLYNNLVETTCMVNRMLPKLNHVLHDVEIFADKIARHPESLGLGGMVRPGSGLKEPPTVLPWKGGH
jgi:phospholipid/cholesterol/gamma-HCH transport system substrate-binding protein